MGSVVFVEFTTADRQSLRGRLMRAGFSRVAQMNPDIDVWEQNGVRLLVNENPRGYAAEYRGRFGSTIASLGIGVDDVAGSWDEALDAGAWPVSEGAMPDLPFPAVFGPEDRLFYLVDVEDFTRRLHPHPEPIEVPERGLVKLDLVGDRCRPWDGAGLRWTCDDSDDCHRFAKLAMAYPLPRSSVQ